MSIVSTPDESEQLTDAEAPDGSASPAASAAAAAMDEILRVESILAGGRLPVVRDAA
jgi:hypothetical protein